MILRSVISLCLGLSFGAASAVTVSIQVLEQPICFYGNGALFADASGGVGPYSYMWNTGATTPSIEGVMAGTYSVTVTDANLDEATANVDLVATNHDTWLQSMFIEGDTWCQDFLIPGPFFRMIVPTEFPGPYSFNGSASITDMSFSGSELQLVSIPTPPGEIAEISFMDGTGCSGTFWVTAGYEVDWPTVSVLQVNGACNGGANGSVFAAFGPEGHGDQVMVEIRELDENIVFSGNFSYGQGPDPYYHTFTGLAPGEYKFVQHLTMDYLQQYYELCTDETFFTIPDLGSTCGTISGLVYVDGNLNCTKQTNEPAVPGALLEVQPGPYYMTANAQGYYSANLPLGNYTVGQLSAQFEEHCAGAPQPFTITGSPGPVVVNFPDSSLVPLDVGVSMASGAARPGFQLQYGIDVRNFTPTNSGATQVVMTFDPVIGYISASPTPSSVIGNLITWNQSQLTAWQQRHYSVHFQVPPDIGLLGTVINASATVSTANTDAAPANNTYDDAVTVTGSYDPNDKVAATSSQYSEELYYIGTDEWIDYTIRFQNTGTDTAFNVIVTDTLPQTLDPATLIVGAGSHPFTWELRDQGVLKFYFINIQLPDSNVNEPLSHGFVRLRILPRQPLLPGTEIENIANIYFDYNPPVITEPSVLVAEFSTGVDEAHASGFHVMPNPTDGILIVQLDDEARVGEWLQVMGIDGRTIRTTRITSDRVEMDVSDLAPGTYILQASTSNVRFIKR